MGDRQHYFAKRVRHIARFGRTCKACGRKSAKLPGVGCLECASLLEVKRRWTVFERDLMESHYRREFCWATQRRLYRETGILRSQRAIQKRAVAWGLTVDHQEGYTTMETAAILGLTKMAVTKAVREGRIKADGKGRDFRVLPAEMERLLVIYPHVPANYINTKEVARRLGVSETVPPLWAKKGRVRSIRHGRAYWIEVGEVERMGELRAARRK